MWYNERMQPISPAERSKKWRDEHKAICSSCSKIRSIKGKGLCSTCYNREWRKSEYARSIIKKSNDERSTRRSKNGKTLWGSKLWHELASMPCAICGWNEASRDIHHITPRSKGGLSTKENLITLCPNHHRMVEEGLIDASKIER